MRIEKDSHAIESLIDWEQFAPPKSRNQWVEERSAYELARAWCGNGKPEMPAELRTLLDSRTETAGMLVDCVYPEHQIRFDTYGGEPRNADMAFVGYVDKVPVAVTIEAKADEPYGATVAKTACDALERRIANPRSKSMERITDLVASLLPPHAKGQSSVGDLCYQLLTATAGTLAYAIEHKAPLAVLVIHEFVTDKTDDARHAQNAAAYRDFIQRLRGLPISIAEIQNLLGPYSVPGRPLFDQSPALLIGKITTNRRGKSNRRDAVPLPGKVGTMRILRICR